MSYTVFPSELTHTNPRKPVFFSALVDLIGMASDAEGAIELDFHVARPDVIDVDDAGSLLALQRLSLPERLVVEQRPYIR